MSPTQKLNDPNCEIRLAACVIDVAVESLSSWSFRTTRFLSTLEKRKLSTTVEDSTVSSRSARFREVSGVPVRKLARIPEKNGRRGRENSRSADSCDLFDSILPVRLPHFWSVPCPYRSMRTRLSNIITGRLQYLVYNYRVRLISYNRGSSFVFQFNCSD